MRAYQMAMLPMTLGDPKPPKFLHVSSPFISLYWVNVWISNLVRRSTVASLSIWTTNSL